MIKKRIYALYKGDNFIDIGTTEYLAKLINVNKRTIYFYSTPSYFKRVPDENNRYIVIEIGKEGDEEDV